MTLAWVEMTLAWVEMTLAWVALTEGGITGEEETAVSVMLVRLPGWFVFKLVIAVTLEVARLDGCISVIDLGLVT